MNTLACHSGPTVDPPKWSFLTIPIHPSPTALQPKLAIGDVDDPLERANLKERRKDLYDRLVAAWFEWNATMLPEINESGTGGFTGDQLADHIGAKRPTTTADNPVAPPK